MKVPRRKILHLAAGAVALATAPRFAFAQAYPTRPVRWIVAVAPGGGNDVFARLMGQWLSVRLGQPFIVENRPGAGNNIGTEAVVRAPPDGYTLLLASSNNASNAALYDNLNFDFIRDIVPVAGIGRIRTRPTSQTMPCCSTNSLSGPLRRPSATKSWSTIRRRFTDSQERDDFWRGAALPGWMGRPKHLERFPDGRQFIRRHARVTSRAKDAGLRRK
jgi:Tripartite tricarboxylate transporter family receptor